MASSTRPGPNLPLINATTARKPHVGGRILRAGGGFSAVDDSGGSVRMQVSSFEYENGEIARYETEARLLEKENSLRSREEALSAREANYERQQHILEKDRVNEADLKARESIAATREIYLEREKTKMDLQQQQIDKRFAELCADREMMRLEREAMAREREAMANEREIDRRAFREQQANLSTFMVQERQMPASSREEMHTTQTVLQPLLSLVEPLQQLANRSQPLLSRSDQAPVIVQLNGRHLMDVDENSSAHSKQNRQIENDEKKEGIRSKEDILDASNVPYLLEQFLNSGGNVPIEVLVGEVEALQQAATRLKVEMERCDEQLKQLKRRQEMMTHWKTRPKKKDIEKLKSDMNEFKEKIMSEKGQINEEDGEILRKLERKFRKASEFDAKRPDSKQVEELREIVAELEERRNSTEKAIKTAEDRLKDARLEGTMRFLPMLLTTVEKYDSIFEDCLVENPEGEVSLNEIRIVCQEFENSTKGRYLRQPPPGTSSVTDKKTLMRLLHQAKTAADPLFEIATAACGEDLGKGCRVLPMTNPTKGVRRCLQKVQEEYEGDYTRLLDLARVTILCDTIVALKKVLKRLLRGKKDNATLRRFRACRIKDRLSRAHDAEQSGGNRDLLINGYLELGANRELIVEVQLHVTKLYDLKHDLHVLYAGARVLGALDDLVISWQGDVQGMGADHDVLSQAEKGVLRRLGVSHSKMDEKEISHLHRLLHMDPCPLMTLDVSHCYSVLGENQTDGDSRPSSRGSCAESLASERNDQGSHSNFKVSALLRKEVKALEDLKGDLEVLCPRHDDIPKADSSGSRAHHRSVNRCLQDREDVLIQAETLRESIVELHKEKLQELIVLENKQQQDLDDRMIPCFEQRNSKARKWSLQKLLMPPDSKLVPIEEEGGIGAKGDTMAIEFTQGFRKGMQMSVRRVACGRLRHLRMSSCGLTGELPLTLKSCHQLSDLRLASNELTGKIPSWLFDLNIFPQLEKVFLAFNKFTGEVPKEFSKSAVVDLLVRNNNLNGRLPKCPPSLETLHMPNNDIQTLESGCFRGCINLKEINLERNSLGERRKEKEGEVTMQEHVDISDCISLENFYIQGQGQKIPSSRKDCKVTGKMHEGTFKSCWKSLRFFDVSNNEIEGSLPYWPDQAIKNNTGFCKIQVQGNKFTGNIPPLPGNCKKFVFTGKGCSNRFEGKLQKLPAGLEKLKINSKYLDTDAIENIGLIDVRLLQEFKTESDELPQWCKLKISDTNKLIKLTDEVKFDGRPEYLFKALDAIIDHQNASAIFTVEGPELVDWQVLALDTIQDEDQIVSYVWYCNVALRRKSKKIDDLLNSLDELRKSMLEAKYVYGDFQKRIKKELQDQFKDSKETFGLDYLPFSDFKKWVKCQQITVSVRKQCIGFEEEWSNGELKVKDLMMLEGKGSNRSKETGVQKGDIIYQVNDQIMNESIWQTAIDSLPEDKSVLLPLTIIRE